MKLKETILFLCLNILNNANGVEPTRIAGGRATAMGNSSVTSQDTWSVFNNQAGISWLKSVGIGVGYENRYLLKELGLKSFGFVLPLKNKGFGLSIQHFGFSGYNEMKVGIAYSMKFGKNFSTGIQLDYFRIGQGEDYGKLNILSFEAGIQFKIDSKWWLGVHIANPIPVKLIKSQKEFLPTIFRLGVACIFSEAFDISAEAETKLDFYPILKIGFEYHPVKPVFIRVGFLTNPGQFTFGTGLIMEKCQFDLGCAYHPVLGYSPTASLSFLFK